MISTDPQKIEELLSRGVVEAIDKQHLTEKLKSGKQLRIKLGIDPTSPNLHVGRAVQFLKLRDFQELGHKVVFIIGDSTGVIGDTSDKDSERPMLAKEKVKQNMKNYIQQAGKILNIKKCEVRRNSEWLGKLNYDEIGEQADQFSLAEFISRENINKRLDAGTRVSLREVLYPLMQGYDSVAVKADVELGGTDQRFNLLAGRKLQSYFKQEPQDIVMGPLLEGTDGRKMSSSWGNTINLTDEPNDMFGKVMSLPDSLIIKYFTLATRAPLSEIAQLEKNLATGANPRDVKMKLGLELVKMYYSEKDAKKAQDNFIKTFSKKEMPDEIAELKPSATDIITVLVEAKICKSKSEARQVIAQGGVKINDKKVEKIDEQVKKNDIVQKGSRFFVKIR